MRIHLKVDLRAYVAKSRLRVRFSAQNRNESEDVVLDNRYLHPLNSMPAVPEIISLQQREAEEQRQVDLGRSLGSM
jgi:hypothetical protein